MERQRRRLPRMPIDVVAEGKLAGEHLVSEAGKRKLIGCRRRPPSHEKLGRHVAARAEYTAELQAKCVVEGLGNAEVGEEGMLVRPIRMPDQIILGLDVAVNDVLLVHVVK